MFEKQIKTIEDQKAKQIKTLEEYEKQLTESNALGKWKHKLEEQKTVSNLNMFYKAREKLSYCLIVILQIWSNTLKRTQNINL